MVFYVDENYAIISVDTVPDTYFTLHEESGELSGSMFAKLCDTCINLYKHEPQYRRRVNDKNEEITDALGQPEYDLDENGEKILIGWSTYPYADLDIITAIQAEHDAQAATLENQSTELQLALTEQYEANLSLQEEVTSTQIALADLYEGKEV